MSELSSATTFGKKLFLNLFVRLGIHLKYLPDRRNLNRCCPGCLVSFMMFLAKQIFISTSDENLSLCWFSDEKNKHSHPHPHRTSKILWMRDMRKKKKKGFSFLLHTNSSVTSSSCWPQAEKGSLFPGIFRSRISSTSFHLAALLQKIIPRFMSQQWKMDALASFDNACRFFFLL